MMKLRVALVLGVLLPLALFGSRKEKATWEKHWQAGMELYKQSRYAEAIPKFQAVVRLLPERSSGHAMLGKCLFNLEDFAGALLHFQEAHRLSPEDGDAVYRLVAAHLALKEYGRVLEIVREFGPSGVPIETRGEYFRAAGLAAFALGDFRGAADHFVAGLTGPQDAARPPDLRAWLVKALIQQARRESGEQQAQTYQRAYPEAAALSVSDPSAGSHLLAAEAALAGGRYKEAEVHARAVLQTDAGEAFGFLYLGQALCGLDRFGEAVAPLESAGKYLPAPEGRKAAWNQLGYAWERLGDRAKAVESYSQAGNDEKVRKLSDSAPLAEP